MNVFLSSMQNFKALTDPAKLNRKPERIRIKTVTQQATLEQVFRSLNVPAARLEELAILNGLELTGTVPKGSLVKVVGQ